MRLFFILLFTTFLFANQQGELLEDSTETIPVEKEFISDNIIDSDDFNLNIAIILDKNKFFHFIPNLLKSMNAYLLNKGINYHIKVFDKEANLDEITQKYRYIFLFLTNSDEIKTILNYQDNYFFIPTLNINQFGNSDLPDNLFFGGIDYREQVEKLNQFISGYTIIIYNESDLLKYITTIQEVELIQPHKILKYPIRNFEQFNDTFVYLNTSIVNTAQILSDFTYHKTKIDAVLSTQINFSPLLFSLTNYDDTKNLIIANSILNINPIIEDNNKNLDTDIDFNWLNYTSSVLLNVAYNLEIGENKHFINDFNLYLYFNQVDYSTNLYKIYKKGFIKIEE